MRIVFAFAVPFNHHAHVHRLRAWFPKLSWRDVVHVVFLASFPIRINAKLQRLSVGIFAKRFANSLFGVSFASVLQRIVSRTVFRMHMRFVSRGNRSVWIWMCFVHSTEHSTCFFGNVLCMSRRHRTECVLHSVLAMHGFHSSNKSVSSMFRLSNANTAQCIAHTMCKHNHTLSP